MACCPRCDTVQGNASVDRLLTGLHTRVALRWVPAARLAFRPLDGRPLRPVMGADWLEQAVPAHWRLEPGRAGDDKPPRDRLMRTRVKARRQRELVTMVGAAAAIGAGEFVQGQRHLGQRLDPRAPVQGRLPQDGPADHAEEWIERYLGAGMISGVAPVYSNKLSGRSTGRDRFDRDAPAAVCGGGGDGPERASSSARAVSVRVAFRPLHGDPHETAGQAIHGPGEPAVVERLRQITSGVVEGIAVEGRVGGHEGSVALLPERPVVAPADARDPRKVAQVSSGRSEPRRGTPRPRAASRRGSGGRRRSPEVAAVRVEPAEQRRVALAARSARRSSPASRARP